MSEENDYQLFSALLLSLLLLFFSPSLLSLNEASRAGLCHLDAGAYMHRISHGYGLNVESSTAVPNLLRMRRCESSASCYYFILAIPED